MAWSSSGRSLDISSSNGSCITIALQLCWNMVTMKWFNVCQFNRSLFYLYKYNNMTSTRCVCCERSLEFGEDLRGPTEWSRNRGEIRNIMMIIIII